MDGLPDDVIGYIFQNCYAVGYLESFVSLQLVCKKWRKILVETCVGLPLTSPFPQKYENTLALYSGLQSLHFTGNLTSLKSLHHLHALNFESQTFCEIPTFFSNFKYLQRLRFVQDYRENLQNLLSISGLVSLTSLQFVGKLEINAEELPISLVELRLEGTTKNPEQLTRLSKLQKLSLLCNLHPIPDQNSSIWSNLGNLTYLYIKSADYFDEGFIRALTTATKLHTLRIMMDRWSTGLIEKLNCKKLHLIQAKQLPTLNTSRLEKLTLYGFEPNIELQHCTKLQSLKLLAAKTPKKARILGIPFQLKHLHLYLEILDSQTMNDLPHFSLESICLRRCTFVNPISFEHWKVSEINWTKLELLSLLISTSELSFLVNCKNLKHLSVNGTKNINNRLIPLLKNCHQLEFLDVIDTSVTKRALLGLSYSPFVRIHTGDKQNWEVLYLENNK
jgi:hypothetical protein